MAEKFELKIKRELPLKSSAGVTEISNKDLLEEKYFLIKWNKYVTRCVFISMCLQKF